MRFQGHNDSKRIGAPVEAYKMLLCCFTLCLWEAVQDGQLKTPGALPEIWTVLGDELLTSLTFALCSCDSERS